MFKGLRSGIEELKRDSHFCHLLPVCVYVCVYLWSSYLARNHSFLISKMVIIIPFGAVLRITQDDA